MQRVLHLSASYKQLAIYTNMSIYPPLLTLQIINFYFNIVVSEFKKGHESEIYTFSTQFYHKLSKSGFEGVKKWTKKVYTVYLIIINELTFGTLDRLIYSNVNLYLFLYTLDAIGHWWWWTAEKKQ